MLVFLHGIMNHFNVFNSGFNKGITESFESTFFIITNGIKLSLNFNW